MQALENLFDALNDGGTIHVESAILDGIISPYTQKVHRSDGCHMEFYPKAEFGNNPTNWWVPTLRCIKAMMETVGFVDVETWRLTDEPENLAQCRGFAKGRKP
jgi:tRNA (mo5U34)-methyltransferase